jgi:PEP-CTERM motif-containing protein
MSNIRSGTPVSRNRRLELRLARYALAASSVLAASALPLPAKAGIVYTNAFGSESSPIDLNRDGIPDFFFSTISGNRFLVADTFTDTIPNTIGGNTIGFIFNTIGGIVANTIGGVVSNTIGGIVADTFTHLATVLGAGVTVGPSLTYFESASVDSFGANDGFAGVHFDVVTRTPILATGGTGATEVIANGEFGWFQFQKGSAVLAAADTSGGSVVTGVPEPSSLELMALGAVGLAALRARRRRPT